MEFKKEKLESILNLNNVLSRQLKRVSLRGVDNKFKIKAKESQASKATAAVTKRRLKQKAKRQIKRRTKAIKIIDNKTHMHLETRKS